MQNPRKPHLKVISQIVRYVLHTIDCGILYAAKVQPDLWIHKCMLIGQEILQLRGRLLVTRLALDQKLFPGVIRKQLTYALSSTKLAAQVCTWLLQLVGDSGQDTDYTVGIYCDSQRAIRLAMNSVFHARTKLIEVHHHFIWEKVVSGEVELVPVATKNQVALFTKASAVPKYMKFRSMLGVCTKESVMRADIEERHRHSREQNSLERRRYPQRIQKKPIMKGSNS